MKIKLQELAYLQRDRPIRADFVPGQNPRFRKVFSTEVAREVKGKNRKHECLCKRSVVSFE